ncbi:polysaccharide deacetylase family sporulation protein PdaB [Metabacillus lacus]|uniref:polysaccharide deacetylase family sporulation protein PdaB n=1 Tax=Metabacillus lacus TaxID=1983721 RepID=UPI0031B60478
MNNFYVFHIKKLKQFIVVVLAAFVTAGILYLENTIQYPVFSTAEGPKAIYKGENKGNKVALTFNISWGDTKAVPILDELKENALTNATFFVSGAWAERHPDVVKRIVKDGHQLGSMGYSYKNYTSIEPEELKKDLMLTREVFKKLEIKDVHLLRPPTGNFNKEVLEIASSYGFTVVHYSIDTDDWTNPGVKEIVKQVSKTRAGDIVLLHASDSAKQTAKALPQIASTLKKKNLSNVTVEELIANVNAQTSEIN